MPKRQTTRSRRPRASRTSGRSRQLVPTPGTEYQAPTVENRAALRIVRALRGPNHKYIVSNFNVLGGSPTPAVPIQTLLNGVGQGTSENARIGRLVKNLWLDIDLEFAVAANNTTTDSTVRFYIVVDNAANGAAFSKNLFLRDTGSVYPFSQRDRTNANAQRFVVLFDSKPFVLGNPRFAGVAGNFAIGCGQPATRCFSKHINLGFSTDYSLANNADITDISANSLYFFAVSDDSSSNIFITGGYTICLMDDS